MEAVLNVHVKGVKIKSFSIQISQRCIFYKKSVYREIHVLICTRRTICSTRGYDRNNGWVNTSSSNMREVVDENSNLYRNIVMNAMKMNQSYID